MFAELFEPLFSSCLQMYRHAHSKLRFFPAPPGGRIIAVTYSAMMWIIEMLECAATGDVRRSNLLLKMLVFALAAKGVWVCRGLKPRVLS